MGVGTTWTWSIISQSVFLVSHSWERRQLSYPQQRRRNSHRGRHFHGIKRTQSVYRVRQISRWQLSTDRTRGVINTRHQYKGTQRRTAEPQNDSLTRNDGLAQLWRVVRSCMWFLPGHNTRRRRADATSRQARPLGKNNKLRTSVQPSAGWQTRG